MFNKQKVSLVLPAYNEEANIEKAVRDFKEIGCFDEILVINNNSTDQTAFLAKKAGAVVIDEKLQGYGFALRRGLKEASGDLIVLSEPDGTFSAQDTKRLLFLTDSADLVMGTRTNSLYIKKGANMKFFLRWGNIFVAKLIQILFTTPTITDCGCTFRVFSRPLLNKLNPYFTVGSFHFLPETVILTVLSGGTIKEIPVFYKQRIGVSKITGSFIRAVIVALKMLQLIFFYKYISLINESIFKKSP